MKSPKQIFVAALLTMLAFCTILYTSCKKDDPDPCSGISCLNGGKCNAGKCVCPTGYEGTYCEITTDLCKNVTCQNGGTCNKGICSCPTGYGGTNCEIKWRDKFIGAYIGSEECTMGVDNYTLTLSAATSGLQLTMTNLYNDSYTATCIVTTENSFTFSGSSGSVVYSGTGNLTANTITVSYSISSGSVSNSCTFTGAK